jgi:Uma2 family endonuclease
MSTTSALMTADELFLMKDDGFRYELVKGELVRMPLHVSEHGATVVNIGIPLGHFVKANKLGVVFGAETGFKIATDPDTVRAPDLAFVHRDRIPEGGLPKAFWVGAPDLAVEVISPGDTYTEVEEKVSEWLDAGARMVIVANPRNRTLKVYRSHTDVIVLTVSDELTCGDIIPGFACKVSEFFTS